MSVEVHQTDPELDREPVQYSPDPEWADVGDEEFFAAYDRMTEEATRRRLLADAVAQAESASRTWRAAAGRQEDEEWVQPQGAHDAYPPGWHVQHEGRRWVSTVPNNVWEPGVTGWREEVPEGDGGEDSYPEWVQPLGAHDAYSEDERVTYDGRVWRSTIDGNVWAPGVHGWEEVTE